MDRERQVNGGRGQMSMEHFRKWLLAFDDDDDGKISLAELTEAFRMTGTWFSGWKARQAMKFADSNGSGFIEEPEIEKLAEFFEKRLGVKIIKP